MGRSLGKACLALSGSLLPTSAPDQHGVRGRSDLGIAGAGDAGRWFFIYDTGEFVAGEFVAGGF